MACSKGPEKKAEQRAYTAQESLAKMHLSEDFNVEVFLNEPQVMSPVEMVFDENGRIYVAEMLDYPDDPPPGSFTPLAPVSRSPAPPTTHAAAATTR